jgi:hypothetical protein
MVEKKNVARQIYRILKSKGRAFILTPNGNYLWYNSIAPYLGMDFKHLSTDEFLTASSIIKIFADLNFEKIRIKYWKFIPKGDIPFIWGKILEILEFFGRLLHLNCLRGGLILYAEKR